MTLSPTLAASNSAYDINSAEMKEKIYDRIKRLKNPQNFIFEIVESEELQDFDVVFDFVKTVGSYGIKIAIDDFGSGYSSLNILKNLPMDTLKLDRLFFKDSDNLDRDKALISSVVTMSRALNMKTVAEGIEKGIAQGRAEGSHKHAIEVAQRMIQHNVPIDEIILFSGLSKEEIEALK